MCKNEYNRKIKIKIVFRTSGPHQESARKKIAFWFSDSHQYSARKKLCA